MQLVRYALSTSRTAVSRPKTLPRVNPRVSSSILLSVSLVCVHCASIIGQVTFPEPVVLTRYIVGVASSTAPDSPDLIMKSVRVLYGRCGVVGVVGPRTVGWCQWRWCWCVVEGRDSCETARGLPGGWGLSHRHCCFDALFEFGILMRIRHRPTGGVVATQRKPTG